MESVASHKSRERSNKNLICVLCSQTYDNKSHLDSHIRSHTKEKVYRCDRCDFEAIHRASLTAHEGVHHPSSRNPQYKCSFCDYHAPNAAELRRHYATHTREKPFACTAVKNCSFRCNRKWSLARHLKTHEEDNERAQMFACKVCHFQTVYQHSLKRHERTHEERTAFIGDVAGCDFRSNWLESLARHKLSHFPDAKSSQLSCPTAGCEFVTSRQSSMKVHLEAQDGVRPHRCEFCEYSAKRKSHLTSHVRHIHTAGPVKTVSCPLCPTLFFTTGDLRVHIHTHTGEKPFRCSEPSCGYAAHHPSKLKRHQKAVHSVGK